MLSQLGVYHGFYTIQSKEAWFILKLHNLEWKSRDCDTTQSQITSFRFRCLLVTVVNTLNYKQTSVVLTSM